MNLLEQSSIPNSKLENEIILVYGDLSTKERIDAVKKMRTIKHSAKNCLDFTVVVPGLFHLKMAAKDAFWRAHVKPSAGRNDATGFFKYIHHLCPKETGKFTNSPGFHRLHDTIHHSTWINVLDCWRLEAKRAGHRSLDKFASAEPSWEVLERISEQMVLTYLPNTNFGDKRDEREED